MSQKPTALKHIVKQGERWDMLALYYYGNALEFGRIIDANPHIAFCETLPTGATLFIPILEMKPTNNNAMPPWLRGADE